MNEDKKPNETTAPEPVVISPGGKEPAVEAEVKKAVMETPPLDKEPAAEPEVKTTPPVQPEKVEPQVVTPASPATPDPQPAAAPASAASQPTDADSLKKPKKIVKKGILVAIIAGFFLVGGGAAAYLTLVQKSPEDIWKSALNNTAEGLDKFLELSTKQTDSYKIDGSLEISEPLVAKGTFTGQADQKSGNSEFEAGFSTNGLSLDAEIKTLKNSSDSPEVYFKLKGLESFAPLLSLYAGEESGQLASLVTSINNQWYLLDDSTLGSLAGGLDTSSVFSTEYSEEEIKEASEAVASVVKDYMLSVKEGKAVFMLEEKIGKEKFEDTDTYKYKVKVNKDNLKNMVEALVISVEGTIIEDALKTGSESGDLPQDVLNSEELIKAIDDSEVDNVYAHVWAEDNGGFIRNIRIYPFKSGEGSEYIDFSLDYQGGDVFPFEFKITQDSDENSGFAAFGIEINQVNADSRLWFDLDIKSGDTSVVGEGSLSVESTDAGFTVEAPKDAKNVSELLGLIYGGPTTTTLDPSLYPANPSLYDDFEL